MQSFSTIIWSCLRDNVNKRRINLQLSLNLRFGVGISKTLFSKDSCNFYKINEMLFLPKSGNRFKEDLTFCKFNKFV